MLTDDLDVQISKETASDVKARQMRHNSDRGNQCNLNNFFFSETFVIT